MWPFKRKSAQRFISIIGVLIGTLLMVTSPVWKPNAGITLSGFILGVIIFFISMLYFFDVQ